MNKFNALKNRFWKRAMHRDDESIHKMNQPNLNFLRSAKSHDLSFSNLQEVTFDFNNDNINDIVSCFNVNGIVVFPNFLSEKLIAKIKSSIQAVINDAGSNLYSQTSNEKEFRRFRKIRPNDLLVNKRANNDSGMLDIYNVDNAFDSEIRKELNSLFASDRIKKLLKTKENDSGFQLSFNSYYNKSVQSTRGFHVDAFYPVIKGMIYLSDVNDLESGAYCYVKRSHRPNFLTAINKKISRIHVGEFTETPIVEVHELTPVLGKAGTLIFSDQAGAHRGLPQSANRERTMLVSKFIIDK